MLHTLFFIFSIFSSRKQGELCFNFEALLLKKKLQRNGHTQKIHAEKVSIFAVLSLLFNTCVWFLTVLVVVAIIFIIFYSLYCKNLIKCIVRQAICKC